MDTHEFTAGKADEKSTDSGAAPNQQQRARPSQVHDDVPIQEHLPPTLEEEISQLTSSLSSWWGSVTKQSQATLTQARSHIQKQGGILNAAKTEWSKLEDHLNDAQQKARDVAFSPADDDQGKDPILPAATDDDILEHASSATTPSIDKGKGRAPPSPVNEEHASTGTGALARSATGAATKPQQMISADGTIIDDKPISPSARHTRNSMSIDINAVAREAQVQASQFANNASSFFSRIGTQIASDPRVANLQKSLSNSLPSGPATADATSKDAAPAAGEEIAEKGEGAAAQPKGGKNALPSWSTTQALARKYWAEAEAVARDVGKDVRELVNEVVQVVPPTEAEQRQQNAGGVTREALKTEVDKIAREKDVENSKAQPSASGAKGKKSERSDAEVKSEKKAAKPEDDEDFDWGEGDEEDGVKASGPSASDAPATTTVPASKAPETEVPAAANPAKSKATSGREAVATGLKTTTGPRTDRYSVDGDEDGDSDWE
ncbi:hypothetical protein OC845_001396 [Tilletia horrida]|nr:hypothetical protein OC845_001396 [Tilletia horrida]